MSTQGDLAAYQFKADLAKFQLIVDLNTRDFVRRLVLEIWNGITRATPVDTGRARSSWGIILDGLEVPTPGAGNYAAPQMPATIEVVDGTQTVAIISSVEYIQALEDGHSSQAPAGMVRITLETIAEKMNVKIAASEAS